VIGRASSEAVKDLDTRAAASKLGVANILTGSVRRSPKMVRISAQLISGSDGVERWAQSYDRTPGDEIKVQTDIAANVATALSIALGQAGRAAITLGGTLTVRRTTLPSREIFVTADGKRLCTNPSRCSMRRSRATPAMPTPTALKAFSSSSCLSDARTHPTGQQADASRGGGKARDCPGAGWPCLCRARLDRSRSVQLSERLAQHAQALALSPEEPSVVSPASIFMLLRRCPEGAELADRAILLDPLRAVSHARRRGCSQCATLRSRLAPAARPWSRPKGLNSQREIADCLVLMNRPAEALTEYRKVPPIILSD
jgi:hypothetical protein